jgi:predicted membrane protein
MDNRMNKNLRNGLIIAIIIVVAILAALWAASTSLFPRFPFEPHEIPPYREIGGDIELFYTIETVVSTINVTLSVFLLAIYVNIYRKTRSEFTIGLTIFSAVFLMNALALNPFVQWAFGFHAFGLGPFAMLPDVFTLGALAVLLYLSFEY